VGFHESNVILSQDTQVNNDYRAKLAMKPTAITHGRFGWRFTLLIKTILLGAVARADPLDLNCAEYKIKPVVPLKAQAFGLDEVQLLPGLFLHARELDEQYLLSLDVDRLLHNFRVNAGLVSNAKPLGGWEAPDCELRGHFVGHYLSACALMYASTGEKRLKEKGDEVVAGLSECQAKMGSGYLSAYPESYFDRVEKRIPVWAPYYTLHKIFAGLEDMYVYCGNQQALDAARKFGDWVIRRNSTLTDEQMQAMLGTEQGGMNETLANLYALTGEEKYLKISLRFDHHRVIEPAEHQEDKLTGLHANTQIPKFIGTARQYELTGNPALKTASLFFWNTVTKERSYVIGGHSDGEMFSPKERLSKALGRNTTETCNTYNMLKLTRHLFCWDPKAEYADYYERALYNHILASQNPRTGMMCYYVPLRSGSRRDYNTANDSFWCCTGTGVENHAKYEESIYFHDDSNLYVNLFIASELNWKGKGLRVRQATTYPDTAETELLFTCTKPVELTVQLRHPYWATGEFEVQVNGTKQGPTEAGSYMALRRTWKTGDRVTVRMPFSLRTEGFKDNPNRFALLNGPLVLCAAVQARGPFPAVVADDATLLASLQAVPGKPNTFTAPSKIFRVPGEEAGEPVTLAPFYQAYDEHYQTYWDRFTAAQWGVKEEAYKKELAVQRALEARTVDYVQAGEEQDERDHNLQGEQTDTREFNDQTWRVTNTNGWFSWDLKVKPDRSQELQVELGANRRGNALVLLIGDTKLMAEAADLTAAQEGPRVSLYKLPPELIKDRQKITVKFQARNDARGTGVASARVVQANQ
jgi:DUF1680 family protein